MSNILTYVRHSKTIRKGRVIADDKRWMIRGVDREIRKAIKDAAKAEGISVGIWVRRGLLRTLEATANGPATLLDLSERMGVLEARLSVLEKSHRALHQSVQATDRPTTNGASEQDKMASHQEIEVKLRADPEKIAKIRRSRWWRELEPISRQSLHSIYFDTSDRQLRDSNISLRTRADGHVDRADGEIAERRLRFGIAPGVGDARSRPDPRPVPGHRSDPAAGVSQAHVGRPATRVRRRRQAGDAPPDVGPRQDRRVTGQRRGDRR